MLYAAILAGGKSSRMGENKALMPLGERLVIEKIARQMKQLHPSPIVIANQPAHFSFLHLPVHADRVIDKGPLGGIEAALAGIPEGYIAISACDTPFISSDIYRFLFSRMEGQQAIIPFYGDRMHPLSGIYHSNVLQLLQKSLQNNELKIKDFLHKIDYRLEDTYPGFTTDELDKHFFNMNHRSDYEQAMKILNS